MPYLHTLGRFALGESAGSDQTLLPPGKPLALLTWLALGDQREVSREQAANLLWETLPPERALHSLRQAILVLRKALGPDALVTTRSSIRLAIAIDSDHDAFLAATRDGDHELALALHRGDFLADVSTPGGSAFDKWASQVRHRIRQTHLTAASTHAELLLGSDQPERALAAAIELRRTHPDSQLAWRLVIGAHLQLRNLNAARQEAQELERILTERHIRAEPATRELLVRFGGASGDGRSQPDDPLLVGRDDEFSRLVAGWHRTRIGKAESMHITGEAGIGKSRLLDATADRLAALGATLVQVRISPGDRELQRAALAVLVDSLARVSGAKGIDPASAEALVALVPSLQQVFAAAKRPVEPPPSQWLTAAIAELITVVASDSSLVLMIDDLHWADPESLDVIGAAIARSSESPLLVITTSRHGRALPGTVAESMHLQPLSVEAITELLASLGDGEAAELTRFAGTLLVATHGNPLFIVEALRGLLASGAVSLADEQWQVDIAAVQNSLAREVPLLQRIRRLDRESQALMNTLAVSGHPISETALQSLFPTAHAALATLELTGLARRVPHGWEVSHDRFAETLCEQMDGNEMARRRSEIAAVLLEQVDSSPATLVVALSHAKSAGNRELMLRSASRWLNWHRQSGSGISAPRLIGQLAAAAGDPSLTSELSGAIPVGSRPLVRVAIAALLLIGVVLPFTLQSDDLPDYILQLEQQPSIDWGDASIPGTRGFVVPVTIGAYRRDGTPDTTVSDTLTMRMIDGGSASLLGDTIVVMQRGRAVFENVLVRPDTERVVTIAVTHSSLGEVMTRQLSATRLYGGELHLTSGMLNGQRVGVDNRRIVISPGDTISGRLRFRYRSDWKHAVVVFCGIRTWLSREAGLHEFETIQTPVVNGILDRAIAIPGPTEPGQYRLLFAFRAERNCPLLASFTNWTLNEPNWDDGPDIQDLTDAQLAQADKAGYLELPLIQADVEAPYLTPYAVQTIYLEVRP